MPHFKLKKLQREKGNLHKIIPHLLEKHNGSQKDVADALDVSQATISRFLQTNGYEKRVVWVRVQGEAS